MGELVVTYPDELKSEFAKALSEWIKINYPESNVDLDGDTTDEDEDTKSWRDEESKKEEEKKRQAEQNKKEIKSFSQRVEERAAKISDNDQRLGSHLKYDKDLMYLTKCELAIEELMKEDAESPDVSSYSSKDIYGRGHSF